MPSTEFAASDIPDAGIGIMDLMVRCGLAPSKSEARRLVDQGGVTVNDAKATVKDIISKDALTEGVKIRKGKKVFHKAKIV